ncbi:hypothetical protein FSARC_13835 [Fusarium sarcochroum]|uniref:glutathione-specific gamma-glutamylcyclotransferase n=1 Tax=Fusarium sarcochroum TaxID=1208366 RepID=A0A8H4SYN5_9HYPO|nr:hypothetical protein FSARC_13835 [Fusarium sarcochroum]
MYADSGSKHRGTADAPGRVATLIEKTHWESLTKDDGSAPELVWGVAYRISSDRASEVKDSLDIREGNGYTIHHVLFQPADGSPPIKTLVYIGTPDNPHFKGPEEPGKLAGHIWRSHGPSGSNTDYLLQLEVALEDLAPGSGDDHVSDLARRIRLLECQMKT